MDYISAREIAEKWNVSLRQVQKLCMTERIVGARRLGNGKVWLVPSDAQKPVDKRYKHIK